MITLLLVVAALAWLLWPKGQPLPSPPQIVNGTWFPPATEPPPPAPPVPPAPPAPPPPPAPPAGPSEREAIDSLLVLRNRLAADGTLPEGSAKAIDTLALDLLHQGAKR